MKYLKHFANVQDAVDYIDNFDGNYNFLASAEGYSGVAIIHGGGSSTFIVSWLQESWLNIQGTCNGVPFSSGNSLPAGSTIVLTCSPYGVDPHWVNVPNDAIISGDGWVATFTLNSNVTDAYCEYLVN